MFWNVFLALCEKKGKKPNSVAGELGFSSAAATKWKNGSVPSARNLQKIANYFKVPVASFFNEEMPVLIQKNGVFGNHNKNNVVTVGSSDMIHELTEMQEELLRIFNKLDMKRKNALLMRAYELEEK